MILIQFIFVDIYYFFLLDKKQYIFRQRRIKQILRQIENTGSVDVCQMADYNCMALHFFKRCLLLFTRNLIVVHWAFCVFLICFEMSFAPNRTWTLSGALNIIDWSETWNPKYGTDNLKRQPNFIDSLNWMVKFFPPVLKIEKYGKKQFIFAVISLINPQRMPSNF